MAFTIEVNFFCRFKHLKDALLCERRREDDGEVGEGCHTFAYGIFEVRNHLLCFFFHRIPLIHHHNKAFVVTLHKLEDIHILRLDTTSSINKENANIRVFNGTNGTHHTIKLQIFRHFVLFADTCRINQVKIKAKFIVARQD